MRHKFTDTGLKKHTGSRQRRQWWHFHHPRYCPVQLLSLVVERTVVRLPPTAPGNKKAYLCSAVDLRLSVRKNLWGLPSALHLAILPLVQSSLHRWLPSSYAYLLIMLQGSFPPQGYLTGQRDDNTGKSNCTQMAYITGCFQESSNVELFFSGSTSSWLDLSVFSFLFLRCTLGTVWTPTQWAEMQHCAVGVQIHDTSKCKIRFVEEQRLSQECVGTYYNGVKNDCKAKGTYRDQCVCVR